MDDIDYLRFTRSLYLFNDIKQNEFRHSDFANNLFPERQELLVHILAYCLMPNHFHLLIAYEDKKQLSHFIQKISSSYTKYFNIRYKRSGFLFQGKYKMKTIEDEDSLLHVSAYIHANPITARLTTDLYKYKWSSLNGFVGLKNNPVITRDYIHHPPKAMYEQYIHDLADNQDLKKALED